MKKILILTLLSLNFLIAIDTNHSKYKEFQNIDYIYIKDEIFKRTTITLKNEKGESISKREHLEKVIKKDFYI